MSIWDVGATTMAIISSVTIIMVNKHIMLAKATTSVSVKYKYVPPRNRLCKR